MRTDIMKLSVESSAKSGGLSEYELICAREMYPNISHILDLVEDLQDQIEKMEEEHRRELNDMEDDLSEQESVLEDKIRDATDCLNDAAVAIDNALGELYDNVEEEPLEHELVEQINIDCAVENMRETYLEISRAQSALE